MSRETVDKIQSTAIHGHYYKGKGGCVTLVVKNTVVRASIS